MWEGEEKPIRKRSIHADNVKIDYENFISGNKRMHTSQLTSEIDSFAVVKKLVSFT